MSNKLTPQQTFEKKIEDRLRSDIGDLIPDELLQQLVSRAIEKNFFEQVKHVEYNAYSADKVTYTDSFFVQKIQSLLEERVSLSIDKWIAENQDLVAEKIESTVKAAPETLVLNAISSMFNGSIQSLQWQMQAELDNRLNNQ